MLLKAVISTSVGGVVAFIVTLVREVQPLNAFVDISVIPVPIVIVSTLIQLRNALAPILVTLFGNVIAVKLEQL